MMGCNQLKFQEHLSWHLLEKPSAGRSLGLHRLVVAEHPFDLRGEMSIFLVDKRGTWSAKGPHVDRSQLLKHECLDGHDMSWWSPVKGATQSWCYPWRSDDVDGRRWWYLLGGGSRSQHRGSLLFSKFWWKRAFHWCSQGRELWGCGLTGEWLMPRKSRKAEKTVSRSMFGWKDFFKVKMHEKFIFPEHPWTIIGHQLMTWKRLKKLVVPLNWALRTYLLFFGGIFDVKGPDPDPDLINPAHRIFPLGKAVKTAFQDASVFTEAAVEEGQPGQPPKRRRMKWFWSRLSLRFQVVPGCYISAQRSGWHMMAPLLVPADFWCDLDIPGDRDSRTVAPSKGQVFVKKDPKVERPKSGSTSSTSQLKIQEMVFLSQACPVC